MNAEIILLIFYLIIWIWLTINFEIDEKPFNGYDTSFIVKMIVRISFTLLWLPLGLYVIMKHLMNDTMIIIITVIILVTVVCAIGIAHWIFL